MGCYPDRCAPGECVLQVQTDPQQARRLIGMWDQERESPLLYAGLYVATIVVSMLISYWVSGGA